MLNKIEKFFESLFFNIYWLHIGGVALVVCLFFVSYWAALVSGAIVSVIFLARIYRQFNPTEGNADTKPRMETYEIIIGVMAVVAMWIFVIFGDSLYMYISPKFFWFVIVAVFPALFFLKALSQMKRINKDETKEIPQMSREELISGGLASLVILFLFLYFIL